MHKSSACATCAQTFTLNLQPTNVRAFVLKNKMFRRCYFGGNVLFGVLLFVGFAASEHVQTLQSKYRSSLPYNQNNKADRMDYEIGCEYRGVWYAAGTSVPTDEPCLRCRCLRGTLVCYLRVCPALPDPPPPDCVLHLRNGNCCAELKCFGDEENSLLNGGTSDLTISRMEPDDDDGGGLLVTAAHGGGCIHAGTLYAPGSAMATSSECEQCFCISGSERCVRPSCLPAPPGCTPRPSSALFCCPLHYDCHTDATTTVATAFTKNGCHIEGHWFSEGERVEGMSASRCDNCFCMRSVIRCMPLACAPTLLGCTPIVKPGDCCASGYDCGAVHLLNEITVTDNSIESFKVEDRSFHNRNTQKITTSIYEILKGRKQPDSTQKAMKLTKLESGTIKSLKQWTGRTHAPKSHVNHDIGVRTHFVADENLETTTRKVNEAVKILINGSINCTAKEYSSKMQMDPALGIKHDTNGSIDRFDSAEYEDYDSKGIIIHDRSSPHRDDTFMVNVTTQLQTNESKPTLPSKIKQENELKSSINNATKAANGDYDYEYIDATLPPSLPNLKIIPFVAADAVMGKEGTTNEIIIKDLPHIDRLDKLPTQFEEHSENHKLPPTGENADTHEKELSKYPERFDRFDHLYLNNMNLQSSLNLKQSHKGDFAADITQAALKDASFSPPILTEGGFVPKDSATYSASTSVKLSTTTITTAKSSNDFRCKSEDGKIVENGSVMKRVTDCSSCICIFGQLRCHVPACSYLEEGCVRVPSSTDPCCGIVICDNELTTNHIAPQIIPTTPPASHTRETEIVSAYSSTIGDTIGTQITTLPPFKALPVIDEDKMLKASVTINTNQSEIGEARENATEFNEQKEDYVEVDDDDDEGFSFGSVLKLLLSDTYDSTTKRPKSTTTSVTTSITKRTTTSSTPTTSKILLKTIPTQETSTTSISRSKSTTSTPPVTTTQRKTASSTSKPHVDVANYWKKTYPTTAKSKVPFRNSVSFHDSIPERILYHSFISSNIHPVTESSVPEENVFVTVTSKSLPTNKPIMSDRTKLKSKLPTQFQSEATPAQPVNNNEALLKPAVDIGSPTIKEKLVAKNKPIIYKGTQATKKPTNQVVSTNIGTLKLAGCNIYGVMYTAGKLIDELSNPCLECMCTEHGVSCKSTC